MYNSSSEIVCMNQNLPAHNLGHYKPKACGHDKDTIKTVIEYKYTQRPGAPCYNNHHCDYHMMLLIISCYAAM